MSASPLRSKKLMDDILYAVSMYFADILRKHLSEQDEQGFIFCALLFAMGIQVAVEHAVVHWFHGHNNTWSEIVIECIFMCSRTLAFLIVSFSIDIVAGHDAHKNVFWQEHIVLPCLLIFMGIAIMKKISHYEQKKII